MPAGLTDAHNFDLRSLYEVLQYHHLHEHRRLETNQLQAAYDHLIDNDKWIRERLVPRL